MSGLQFRPELLRKVRAGQKTQTRRPVKGDDPCRYRPGRSYAAQPGRGKPATCRVHVHSVELALVGEITLVDAIAEGFATTDDFKVYWVGLHDKAWVARENRMLDAATEDEVDGLVIDRDRWIFLRSVDRFDERHIDKPVWVISFSLTVEEEIRLLAARPLPDYVATTARALPDEPEAVSAHEQNLITERAGVEHAHWRALEVGQRDMQAKLLAREDRVKSLQRAARMRSVDVSNEVYVLRQCLKRSGDESFDRKLAKAEAKVFRLAA